MFDNGSYLRRRRRFKKKDVGKDKDDSKRGFQPSTSHPSINSVNDRVSSQLTSINNEIGIGSRHLSHHHLNGTKVQQQYGIVSSLPPTTLQHHHHHAHNNNNNIVININTTNATLSPSEHHHQRLIGLHSNSSSNSTGPTSGNIHIINRNGSSPLIKSEPLDMKVDVGGSSGGTGTECHQTIPAGKFSSGSSSSSSRASSTTPTGIGKFLPSHQRFDTSGPEKTEVVVVGASGTTVSVSSLMSSSPNGSPLSSQHHLCGSLVDHLHPQVTPFSVDSLVTASCRGGDLVDPYHHSSHTMAGFSSRSHLVNSMYGSGGNVSNSPYCHYSPMMGHEPMMTDCLPSSHPTTMTMTQSSPSAEQQQQYLATRPPSWFSPPMSVANNNSNVAEAQHQQQHSIHHSQHEVTTGGGTGGPGPTTTISRSSNQSGNSPASFESPGSGGSSSSRHSEVYGSESSPPSHHHLGFRNTYRSYYST